MEPIKLERAASHLGDLQKSAQGVAAATITLDALTVYQSPIRAELLGRLWQHISNTEIIERESLDNSFVEQGEEIRSIGWELTTNGFLETTPQYGYSGDGDDDSEDFEYDHECLSEALGACRQAILAALYVEAKDDDQ